MSKCCSRCYRCHSVVFHYLAINNLCVCVSCSRFKENNFRKFITSPPFALCIVAFYYIVFMYSIFIDIFLLSLFLFFFSISLSPYRFCSDILLLSLFSLPSFLFVCSFHTSVFLFSIFISIFVCVVARLSVSMQFSINKKLINFIFIK